MSSKEVSLLPVTRGLYLSASRFVRRARYDQQRAQEVRLCLRLFSHECVWHRAVSSACRVHQIKVE